MTTTHDLPATAHPTASAPAGRPQDAVAPGEDAPLSTLLREGTRAEHEAAEGSRFVEHLLGGELTVDAYVDLALQLLPVYVALEDVAEEVRRTPAGASVVFDELRRVPALQSDLAHLLGPDWRSRAVALPDAEAYADRIRAGAGEVGAYVAHSYTRYLGDLSGGQVIGRMVQRHYGVADQGVSFYAFAEVPKPKPFKDLYRSRVDALDLTDAAREAVVEEARAAFRHNRALFAALGTAHTPA